MTKVLTPELLAQAQRGLRALYLKQFEAATESPWESLFTRYTDAGHAENYTMLGAVSQLREWTGGREFETRRIDGLTVITREYDTAYDVPMIDVQREQLGKHSTWISAAAKRAATFMVPLVRELLANGTSAAKARCWDGKPLFSTSHGVGKGTGQSNIITGSGIATVEAVGADIEQAISAGSTFRDDKGLYIQQVEYNTAIYPAGNAALGGLLRTMIQDRVELGSASYSGLLKSVIACPELTGNTWYLAAGGGTERPFGWQEELPPTPEQSEDFDTRSLKFAVHASGAAFCSDWTCIVQIANS